MRSDGKQLEGLVSLVEKMLLPQGFNVKTNERVYNDEGLQIAEFDIEACGKVGSTNFSWLIECRDRPSEGPAPGSWIEQLVGRRMRFGFNKVTAVSTTGFAVGVADFARSQGIELREVRSLSPEEFEWLMIRDFQFTEHVTRLDHAEILINARDEDKREALSKVVSDQPGDSEFLRSSKNGQLISLAVAFKRAASDEKMLWDRVKPNGPHQKVKMTVNYPYDDDHFVLDTALGPVRVETIIFFGEIFVRESLIPITRTAEYLKSETGEPISQVVSFEPHQIHGKVVSFEIHRIPESGQMQIVMRKVPDNT